MQNVCFVFPKLFNFFIGVSYKNIKKLKEEYGDGWVVITGATSGLGYNYARTFSKLGYNLCLISRDQNKLDKVSKELTENYNINTKIIQHDFSVQDKEKIQYLRQELNNLNNISIVINNVGVLNDLDLKFEDTNIDSLLSMVNVNCTSVLIMYNILLKKLKEQNNRTLIIDVSSLLGDTGYIHNFIVYQATKAFVTHLSKKIKDQINMENRVRKYPVYKIDIMTLKPSHFVGGMSPKTNLFSERPENIVHASLENAINKRFENYGTMKHEYFSVLMKLMPNYLRDNWYAKERYIKGIRDIDSQNVDLSDFINKKI